MPASPGWKNKLFFGDNLKTLGEEIETDSVDLVYLDPPFNSNATYNVLFAEKNGERSAAQIAVFEDTWHWGIETEQIYHETVTAGGKISELIQTLRVFLGQNDMMAYLVMMAPRLLELRRVLKATGTIYLHCDPTASHYLKLIMDAIFGPERFRNEVIWKRTSAHSSAKRYGPVHDVLLFYARSEQMTWIGGSQPYDEAYLRKRFARGKKKPWKDADLTGAGIRHGETGKAWRGFNVTAKGRHWAYPPSELDRLDSEGLIYWPKKKKGWPRFKKFLHDARGIPLQDVITDIPPINSQAQERLGYPTQKPEALLERIIKATTNENDLILDAFCGCGTAISVAERLNRRWIGIDITHLAIALIRHRLHYQFKGQLAPYVVKGDPPDLEGAKALAAIDRYQFEWWALGLVDARPAHDKKKGADKGIDGHIYFFVDFTDEAKKAVVQVKSGHVTRNMIGDLNNARQRERAEIAVFLTLEPATEPMRKEAVAAGIYQIQYSTQKLPRVQILTIEELLEGKRPQFPAIAQPDTYRKPPARQKGQQPKQGELFRTGTSGK